MICGQQRLNPNSSIAFFLLLLLVENTAPLNVYAQEMYCGIYSVYGAAQSLGVNVDFQSLVSNEFVSSARGSTTDDLVRAIGHCKLGCKVFSNLGYRSLVSTTVPLILHVCSDQQLVSYNHWLLFLGISNGQAMVVDSAQGVRLVPIADLLARWDGKAIVVGLNDECGKAIGLQKKNGVFQWMAVTCLILAMLVKVRHPVRCLLATCIGLLVLLHVAAPTGFLRNTSVFPTLEAVFRSSTFRRVEFEWLLQHLDEDEITLLDVRYSEDSQRGMIPKAIALPITSTTFEYDGIVAALPRDRPIVVYCQSQQCPFASIMALRMLGSGFRDIRIYSGGWSDWSINNGK